MGKEAYPYNIYAFRRIIYVYLKQKLIARKKSSFNNVAVSVHLAQALLSLKKNKP